MRSRHWRRGLTLPETLVIAGILVVLSALLLPALSHAREEARQSMCAHNLKHLGLGVSLYADDYEGHFPQTHAMADRNFNSPVETPVLVPWRTRIEWYGVPTLSLFKCVSDRGMPQHHISSYAPNGYLTYGTTREEIASPGDTIYAGELSDNAEVDDLSPWHGLGELARLLATDRHLGKAWYLYVDGHCATHRFEDTWAPKNQWVPQRTIRMRHFP